jgi:hypothetical protein
VGHFCVELTREIQEAITYDEFSYPKPIAFEQDKKYIFNCEWIMLRYCQGGSLRNTLLAREIFSCDSGCNPGVEFSKNMSQKIKQFTAFSDRQFLKRHCSPWS